MSPSRTTCSPCCPAWHNAPYPSSALSHPLAGPPLETNLGWSDGYDVVTVLIRQSAVVLAERLRYEEGGAVKGHGEPNSAGVDIVRIADQGRPPAAEDIVEQVV